MKKLTKRIALTVSSIAVAGAAALGAGGTAAAAPLAPAHAQRPSDWGTAADHSWDHGVGYLLERGYSCDETRGWHREIHGTDPTRHDCEGLYYRHGHFYRWEGEGHDWTSDSSYQHDGNHLGLGRWGRDHLDLNR